VDRVRSSARLNRFYTRKSAVSTSIGEKRPVLAERGAGVRTSGRTGTIGTQRAIVGSTGPGDPRRISARIVPEVRRGRWIHRKPRRGRRSQYRLAAAQRGGRFRQKLNAARRKKSRRCLQDEARATARRLTVAMATMREHVLGEATSSVPSPIPARYRPGEGWVVRVQSHAASMPATTAVDCSLESLVSRRR